MPREPIQLSDDQRHEVETLAALLSQEQIADYFGIARNTFRAICERDADVLERYKKGKAKAIAHVANGLLQKARGGCTTSSIFYLKTQGGWRETERIEHSVPEGVPIVASLGRHKLEAYLDGINGRMCLVEDVDPEPSIEGSGRRADRARVVSDGAKR